jgi:hypothetical protein
MHDHRADYNGRRASSGDGVPDTAVEQKDLAGVGEGQDERGEALRTGARGLGGEAELDTPLLCCRCCGRPVTVKAAKRRSMLGCGPCFSKLAHE